MFLSFARPPDSLSSIAAGEEPAPGATAEDGPFSSGGRRRRRPRRAAPQGPAEAPPEVMIRQHPPGRPAEGHTPPPGGPPRRAAGGIRRRHVTRLVLVGSVIVVLLLRIAFASGGRGRSPSGLPSSPTPSSPSAPPRRGGAGGRRPPPPPSASASGGLRPGGRSGLLCLLPRIPPSGGRLACPSGWLRRSTSRSRPYEPVRSGPVRSTGRSSFLPDASGGLRPGGRLLSTSFLVVFPSGGRLARPSGWLRRRSTVVHQQVPDRPGPGGAGPAPLGQLGDPPRPPSGGLRPGGRGWRSYDTRATYYLCHHPRVRRSRHEYSPSRPPRPRSGRTDRVPRRTCSYSSAERVRSTSGPVRRRRVRRPERSGDEAAPPRRSFAPATARGVRECEARTALVFETPLQ